MTITKPLNRDEILRHAGSQNLAVSVFESLASTNSWALSNPVQPGRGHLCITESQTAGRGRRGNQWQSAAGENITLSFAWCFAAWPKAITGLSLAVGMLVAEQLNRTVGIDVKVKWPNDLMVADKKLGGILIELAGESGGPCQVVLGLGLNVYQPDWSRHDSDYAWQDLHGLKVRLDRNEFVGKLARELLHAMPAFEQHGFTSLRSAWPDFSSYQGRRIAVDGQDGEIAGVMSGVDEYGALLVNDDNGRVHRFLDSNVSVRLVS